ncbi:MAG TPA: sugar-binding domain-containing protein [Capsulimonadaceae bacterium]|jgi:DNA-binding transcriptional regulator LsrR (DeoR family)
MPKQSSNYTDEQLILAARLYFLDGLPQMEIARLVNVSQSKVSRMLALARDRGLVRISVPEYEPRNHELEADLTRALGIEAIVIRAVAHQRDEDLRHVTGYFGAPIVSAWLNSASRVAIAGTRTIEALVEHMKPVGRPVPPTVIQAMGSTDSSTNSYDASELGRSLAARWRGSFLTLNSPAILPNTETARHVLALEQIRMVMAELASADVALLGIGSLTESVFLDRHVLTVDELAALHAAGAVGEILGRFYDAAGVECETALKGRTVSLPLATLPTIRKTVGATVGTGRTAAILAAVEGKLINTLLVDETCASALLLR